MTRLPRAWAGPLAAALAFPCCLRCGATDVSFADVWGALGGVAATADHGVFVVRELRLPRALGALLAGCGLGVAGAIMQAVGRNPLASPTTTGAAPAAVCGASIALAARGGPAAVAAAAIGGAYAATHLAVRLARRFSDRSGASLVLCGVALGFVASAVATLLRFFVDDEGVAARMARWLQGGLWQCRLSDVGGAAALVGPVLLLALAKARALDLLALGAEDARRLGLDDARRLGLDDARETRLLMLGAATAAGAAATLAGLAPFVGLLVPHAARRLAGGRHRDVLPAAAGLGALLLLLADTACRTLVPPHELPLGAATALAGGPLFLLFLTFRAEARTP